MRGGGVVLTNDVDGEKISYAENDGQVCEVGYFSLEEIQRYKTKSKRKDGRAAKLIVKQIQGKIDALQRDVDQLEESRDKILTILGEA